jgi:hypothetical protein
VSHTKTANSSIFFGADSGAALPVGNIGFPRSEIGQRSFFSWPLEKGRYFAFGRSSVPVVRVIDGGGGR